MSERSDDSRIHDLDEVLRQRAGMLDLDEMQLLRAIHAKLDPARTTQLGSARRRYGGFVW